MYFITLFTYSNKFIYLNTFNIEVAHRCSDNRGPTVLDLMNTQGHAVSVIALLQSIGQVFIVRIL